MRRRETVYVLLHCDTVTTNVLSIFADMQDANDECLRHAHGEGVTLTSESSTMGPDKHHITPVEPLRWDTPEGVSCWVEAFQVVPKKVLSPSPGVLGKEG